MTNTSNSFKGYSREFIDSQIRYESADGLYTFTCGCGRRGCRGTKCLLCWQELKDVSLEAKKWKKIM